MALIHIIRIKVEYEKKISDVKNHFHFQRENWLALFCDIQNVIQFQIIAHIPQ